MKTILTLLAFLSLTVATAFAQAPITRGPYTTNAPGATINAAGGSLTNLNTARATLGDFITLRANGTNMNPLVQWLPYAPEDFVSLSDFDDKQDASSVLSNIVDTITVDGSGNMVVTSAADSTGDFRTAITSNTEALAGKMDLGTTISEMDEGAGRHWVGSNAFSGLHLAEGVTRSRDVQTGTAFTIDVQGPPDHLFIPEGHWTVGVDNTPDEGAMVGRSGTVRWVNFGETNRNGGPPEGWILGGRTDVGGIVFSTILPAEVVRMDWEWDGTNFFFYWRGNQDDPLGTGGGGTATTTGKAKTDTHTLGTVTYDDGGSGTNATFDLDTGTTFRLDNTKDAVIHLLSNRLASSNLYELEFDFEMLLPASDRVVRVNTNRFGRFGLSDSNFVAAGTVFRARGYNWGPDDNHAYLVGSGGSVEGAPSGGDGGGEEFAWGDVLIAETFDTNPGYDNAAEMTESASTAEINPDSGYRVGAGEGLTLTETSSDRIVYAALGSDYNSLSGVCSVMITNGYPAATAYLLRFNTGGSSAPAVSVSSSGKLAVIHGSGTTVFSTASIPTNTWVTVYYAVEIVGSGTGVIKAGFSTDGTRATATGDQYKEILTGTDITGPIDVVRLYAEEPGTYHYDNFKVQSEGSYDTLPDAY